MNRIITKKYVHYYMNCKKEQNEVYHSPKIQREFVLQQKENTENSILQSNKLGVIKYFHVQGVDVVRALIIYLQIRNIHLMNVHKKVVKIDNSNIRNYFVLQK